MEVFPVRCGNCGTVRSRWKMMIAAKHVQEAFEVIRSKGFTPNGPSTKWDIIDPKTGERFPPKAVLRVAKEISGDTRIFGGGGWPTNNPLMELGFEIALKPGLEKSDAAADIREVAERSDVDPTTKERLINARLGQGGFREALLEIWDFKCGLTGCDILPALRASHIKPWRESSDRERLDPDNGILLVANADALFDRYLISFADDGTLLTAKSLAGRSLETLGLAKVGPLAITDERRKFLRLHRAVFDEQNV